MSHLLRALSEKLQKRRRQETRPMLRRKSPKRRLLEKSRFNPWRNLPMRKMTKLMVGNPMKVVTSANGGVVVKEDCDESASS